MVLDGGGGFGEWSQKGRAHVWFVVSVMTYDDIGGGAVACPECGDTVVGPGVNKLSA